MRVVTRVRGGPVAVGIRASAETGVGRVVSSARGLLVVFGRGEFRVVWAAELCSLVGDQLARVALAVLIFDRTGSAAWAAAGYALTFLPALLGGVALGRLADRYRRRELMVRLDLARAGLLAVMALPGVPLWLLCALLVVAVALGSPYSAAHGALLPELLGADYESGLAVRQITSQTAQLAGFGVGGLALTVVSPPVALAADAVSFALSAALLRGGLRDRPVPADGEGRGELGRRAWARWTADARAGVRTVATHRVRRLLAGLVWLVGCYVVPEGLAVPYAAALGGGPAAVGLLMAADPAGSVLGAWLFTRVVSAPWRARLVGGCAVAGGLALAGCLARPGLTGSALLWALSGMFSSACLLQAQAGFVRATPPLLRGRAIGVAASGLIAAQGVAVLLGGLLAERFGAVTAVGAVGSAGALLAALLAVRWWGAAGTVENGAGGAPIASSG